MTDLDGKKVALVIGHEPGGGARGEREWNLAVSEILKSELEDRGASVLIYEHKTRAYTRRCREMRASLIGEDLDCVLLMHYNSFSKPSANGHEFHFRSFPGLAASMRDAWQARYPWSKARRDNGILKNESARGSLMIRLAPAPACLTEPFFESNPRERAALIDDQEGVAKAYAEGISNFLLS